MFTTKQKKYANAINAGSMADIAFLLLIFFLVTTTMDADKGIRVLLPPFVLHNEVIPLPDKNILSVKVNAANQLLVEGTLLDTKDLRATTKEFILNPHQHKDKPDKPTKAVISLQNDRGTNFDTYLHVYNELKAAYNELRNEYALQHYGTTYTSLPPGTQKAVRAVIPLVISEAEPTQF